MSLLMDAFSAAFENIFSSYTPEGENRYEYLYHKHMGEYRSAPEQKFVTPPSWEDLSEANPELAKGKLRIGTFPRSPYFYLDPEAPRGFAGWEYDIACQVEVWMANHYPELREMDTPFKFDWVVVEEEDFEEPLPMDGSDNDIIRDELLLRMWDDEPKFDMIFSGILLKPCNEEEAEGECYEFSNSNGVFYVSGLYTGLDDFGSFDRTDIDSLVEYLAEWSKIKGVEIEIIHTENKAQNDIGEALVWWIENKGGKAADRIVEVTDIQSEIENQKAHLYVGDLIQIQVMCAEQEVEEGKSPYQHFDVILVGLQPGEDTEEEQFPSDFQNGDAMDLAPLALKSS